MIVQDDRGVSDFSMLRSSIKRAPEKLLLVVFDLLHLNGKDLRNDPVEKRRDKLLGLVGHAGAPLLFSEAVTGAAMQPPG